MELFERFEEMNDILDRMNAEATTNADIPYVRLHDYLHYVDVKSFLHTYTRRLRLPEDEKVALLDFCYRDTLQLKPLIRDMDLYAFTFHYFKEMTYRTGNLDTPDDCVEKLDMERFSAYKEAREAQWSGAELSGEDRRLLDESFGHVISAMKAASISAEI